LKKSLPLFVVFAVAATAFAATPTNASLKGPYSFQLSSSHLNQWYASINCTNAQGGTYTVSAGGSEVSGQSIQGVVTFDGKGNATGTYTQYGSFDQADSNATVVPSCSGSSNNGNSVYDPPVTGTFTGTYTIQPTGQGALVLNISNGETVDFVLELASTAAVRTSILMTEYDSTTHKVDVSGVAILQ
jgi:hypothetical protein